MKKYYFSKDKYIEREGRADYECRKEWVDICDGKEVIEGHVVGTPYLATKYWCICNDYGEKKSTQTMKFRCTGYKKGERVFTIGKVYDWSEDSFVSDTGFNFNTKPCPFARGTDPTKWELACWYTFEAVPSETDMKIVITTDGKKTTATLFEGETIVKKAIARCHPKDEFDFETGAKISFERLAETFQKSKQEEKTFVPHLMLYYPSRNYGVIGEPTNYKDAVGRPLFVGDTVEHYRNGKSFGETVIVDAKPDGKYVMGIQIYCNEEEGTTGGWAIVKKRSFKDVKNGEKVYNIIYVKEQ